LGSAVFDGLWLFSLFVIVFVIGMSAWFAYFFSKNMREDEAQVTSSLAVGGQARGAGKRASLPVRPDFCGRRLRPW
jgi:hypothetical protein